MAEGKQGPGEETGAVETGGPEYGGVEYGAVEYGGTKGRQRGASPSAIADALNRDPQPGPQHWGGPRPKRAEPRTYLTRKFPRFSPNDA